MRSMEESHDGKMEINVYNFSLIADFLRFANSCGCLRRADFVCLGHSRSLRSRTPGALLEDPFDRGNPIVGVTEGLRWNMAANAREAARLGRVGALIA